MYIESMSNEGCVVLRKGPVSVGFNVTIARTGLVGTALKDPIVSFSTNPREYRSNIGMLVLQCPVSSLNGFLRARTFERPVRPAPGFY